MTPATDDHAEGWETEAAESALARTPAFGRAFFARLFAEFPALKDAAVFRRWSVQPDDVYAIFGGFVIQIDPDLEYIIVSGGGVSCECGDWGDNDRTGDALDRVRALLGDGLEARDESRCLRSSSKLGE